jgi:hypothetical protein
MCPNLAMVFLIQAAKINPSALQPLTLGEEDPKGWVPSTLGKLRGRRGQCPAIPEVTLFLRFQFHPAVANLSKKDQMKAPRGPPRPAWLLAHSSREVRRASILLFSKREMKNHPPIMQQILLCS